MTSASAGHAAVDADLASALRAAGAWPRPDWSPELTRIAIRRAHYHGIAGLLAAIGDLPPAFLEAVRREATARAMWELRHQQVLSLLLERLGSEGRQAMLLKGSALACSLYDEPAHRTRGDSDLWVEEGSLGAVRDLLRRQGFRPDEDVSASEPLRLEEGWVLYAADGTTHVVDLHWSALNSPFLRTLFDFDDCWRRRSALPRLGPHAWRLGHGDALLHSAVHRRLHVSSPYLVDGVTHYGGDRLIWLKDVALLADALGRTGLSETAARACASGLAEALREALLLARDRVGAEVTDDLLEQLGKAPPSPVTRYLASGQMLRAWLDLRQVPILAGRCSAALGRLFPSRGFLAAKYRSNQSYPRLLLRRLGEFVRPRPAQTDR